MTDGPKPLPYTLRVKGRYWYFRKRGCNVVKLPGEPGEPRFMERYNRLLEMSGVKLKRTKQKRRIKMAEHRASVRNQATVYFIGIEPDGPIKIGTAINVKERLCTLQTAVPMPLSILATCEGGRAKEREYHSRFAHARMRGEWFERVPDLLAELSGLENRTGLKDDGENPEKTPSENG